MNDDKTAKYSIAIKYFFSLDAKSFAINPPIALKIWFIKLIIPYRITGADDNFSRG